MEHFNRLLFTERVTLKERILDIALAVGMGLSFGYLLVIWFTA